MASVQLTFVFVLSVTCLGTTSGSDSWNYDSTSAEGPPNWYVNYPACGLDSQSPVDIVTADTEAVGLPPLTLTGYDTTLTSQLTIVNIGHGVQVGIPVKTAQISGAGLNATYTLEQFHFHWGTTSATGSEHVVNGRAYPLEIHLVHYNSDQYDSVTDAISHDNDTTAIAVVGIFADVTSDEKQVPDALDALTDALGVVQYEGQTTPLNGFQLDTLLPNSRSLYRYIGSLTTPGCNQAVIWTVFTEPIHITEEQIAKFRLLHSTPEDIQPAEKLTHNFRPPQSLNGRIVSKFTDNSAGNHQQSSRVASVSLLVVLAAIHLRHK